MNAAEKKKKLLRNGRFNVTLPSSAEDEDNVNAGRQTSRRIQYKARLNECLIPHNLPLKKHPLVHGASFNFKKNFMNRSQERTNVPDPVNTYLSVDVDSQGSHVHEDSEVEKANNRTSSSPETGGEESSPEHGPRELEIPNKPMEEKEMTTGITTETNAVSKEIHVQETQYSTFFVNQPGNNFGDDAHGRNQGQQPPWHSQGFSYPNPENNKAAESQFEHGGSSGGGYYANYQQRPVHMKETNKWYGQTEGDGESWQGENVNEDQWTGRYEGFGQSSVNFANVQGYPQEGSNGYEPGHYVQHRQGEFNQAQVHQKQPYHGDFASSDNVRQHDSAPQFSRPKFQVEKKRVSKLHSKGQQQAPGQKSGCNDDDSDDFFDDPPGYTADDRLLDEYNNIDYQAVKRKRSADPNADHRRAYNSHLVPAKELEEPQSSANIVSALAVHRVNFKTPVGNADRGRNAANSTSSTKKGGKVNKNQTPSTTRTEKSRNGLKRKSVAFQEGISELPAAGGELVDVAPSLPPGNTQLDMAASEGFKKRILPHAKFMKLLQDMTG